MSTPITIPPACRHCGRAKVNRPRGLCWSCYHLPGVKEKYPSTSKYGRRGVGGGVRTSAPATPTDALPGTSAKVDVMKARAKAGQALFHPGDGYLPPPSRRKHSPHYRPRG